MIGQPSNPAAEPYPLPGTEIVIRDTTTGEVVASGGTDDDGLACFEVPPGSYQVELPAEKFYCVNPAGAFRYCHSTGTWDWPIQITACCLQLCLSVTDYDSGEPIPDFRASVRTRTSGLSTLLPWPGDPTRDLPPGCTRLSRVPYGLRVAGPEAAGSWLPEAYWPRTVGPTSAQDIAAGAPPCWPMRCGDQVSTAAALFSTANWVALYPNVEGWRGEEPCPTPIDCSGVNRPWYVFPKTLHIRFSGSPALFGPYNGQVLELHHTFGPGPGPSGSPRAGSHRWEAYLSPGAFRYCRERDRILYRQATDFRCEYYLFEENGNVVEVPYPRAWAVVRAGVDISGRWDGTWTISWSKYISSDFPNPNDPDYVWTPVCPEPIAATEADCAGLLSVHLVGTCYPMSYERCMQTPTRNWRFRSCAKEDETVACDGTQTEGCPPDSYGFLFKHQCNPMGPLDMRGPFWWPGAPLVRAENCPNGTMTHFELFE